MRSLFSLLLIFGSFTIHAQSVLTALIIDDKQQAVEFANFRLFSLPDSSVVAGGYSNNEGKIEIAVNTTGRFYGVITFFGYKDYTTNVIVINEKNQNINLKTIQITAIKSQEFEEIVIQGKQNSIMESSIDKRTYNVEEDMTAIGGSINDVLNNIPSVEVDEDGNVSLRGNGSVTILIDGRESVLSSGDGALDGIPASAIERIEVVTNPSAKYNPDGTAGIINIVLKKKKLRGLNFDASVTAATENLYNGSINFNYRNEFLNFYANYSMRYREGERNNTIKRTSTYKDSIEYLLQERLGSDLERSHTGKIGTDIFIDTNQVIGISVSGSITDRNRGGNQRNNLYQNDILQEFWSRSSYEPRNRKSFDINADYKLDFADKKGNLMLAATESVGQSTMKGSFDEYYFLSDGSPAPNSYRYQSQGQNNKNNRFTLKADLERNINEKMKYETGIQTIIYRMDEDNSLTYFDTVTNQEIPNLNADNRMLYDENIFSAYGTLGHRVTNFFSYQAGIRMEQAFSKPKILATNTVYNKDYFSLFPSLHLLLGDEDFGEFFISYSRRINRPRPWFLNPFPTYSDPLNIRQGNPGLMPEYINSYELGYEKNWSNFGIISSIYFKQTEGKIERIRKFQDDGVSIMTFANIAESQEYGVEIIGNYSPFPWWRNMFSINAYESRLSANIDGVKLSNKGISWNAKLNTTFLLFKNTTKVQFTGQYVAPRHTVQGVVIWQPGFDIGASRSFLNKKLEIGVKVTDIFNQRHSYSEVTNGHIYQESTFEWTSRRLFLTLSYKFRNIRASNEDMRRGFNKLELEQPMED